MKPDDSERIAEDHVSSELKKENHTLKAKLEELTQKIATQKAQISDFERRFEFALESSELSWWDWDLEKGDLVVSTAGSCLLGDECLNVPRNRDGWLEWVHPEDRVKVGDSLDACLEARTDSWICEHRFRTDAGDWLWVKNRGVVTQRDAGSKPLKMMGTTQNVNIYKEAIDELQNKEAILATADEIASLGAWDYDPETDLIYWSEQTRKILEVDEDFDPAAEKLYAMMSPEDGETLRKAFEQTCADGTPYDLQLCFITAKGRKILCRTASRARFDEDGKVIRVIGIFQDITELKKMQEELRAIFDLSPDFQAALEMKDGSFKIWSPSWEKQLGYSSAELSSMCVSEIILEEDRLGFEEILKQAASGVDVTNYETRLRPVCSASPDADQSWMSWSFTKSSELSLIFVSGRCVTEAKKTERALQKAHIKVVEASQAKSNFLAVMSHELRTPLNPILGFADLLAEEAASEQKEILDIIVESGTQMVSLIDDILEYSKIDAWKKELDTVEFSLANFVEEINRLMSGMVKDAKITLSDSINWGPLDGKSQPGFLGDIGMMRQIARNLISNAIKFTKQGKVEFDVTVIEIRGETAIVRFDVTDEGIGISEKVVDAIFEPFTQVQAGTTREFGGTGLGLAICKRLLDLMGGEISVRSKEGIGSTFSFTLPLRLVERKKLPSASEDSERQIGSTQKEKFEGKILLVEDNKSNALYVKTLLESRGTEVVVAERGETALQLLNEHSFDLMLLDLHMPGIGGTETLKRIRESGSGFEKLPVYILTADASDEAKNSCEKYGSDGFLTKPVKPASIFSILETCLRGA